MASFIPKIFASTQNPVTKRHTVKRILAIPPQHLYNIILDVDSYSDFVPYCKSSQIIRRSKCDTMFDATLQIGFGGVDLFQEEYVSRVTKKIHSIHDDNASDNNSLEWVVTAKSIKSNLFHGLSSSWKLREANGRNLNSDIGQEPDLMNESVTSTAATNVEFEVEISVCDPIIMTALDSSLEEVAKQQVAAFEKRCFDIPSHV